MIHIDFFEYPVERISPERLNESVVKKTENNKEIIEKLEMQAVENDSIIKLIVLGGDGSILKALHQQIKQKINKPIFGLNFIPL